MNKKRALLETLCDGKFHSGEVLAKSLGVSRMSVWKQVQVLRSYGLDIFSVKRKGYCLASPVELFEISRLRKSIGPETLGKITNLEISFQTVSTNMYLMDKLPHENIHGHVVIAEYQSAGKGSKDNRKWVSPLGAGLYMSIGWHFDTYPNSFTALSLSAGVAVTRALNKSGISGLSLKWPNDIISRDRKLGGILIESRGITKGHCDIVIGIGINIHLPSHVNTTINQPFTDLSSIKDELPPRNALAGAVIKETLNMLEEFRHHGFSGFINEWRSLDYFAGKNASLVFPDRVITGRVLGIDQNGMLSMSINGRKKQFAGGELSLRSYS